MVTWKEKSWHERKRETLVVLADFIFLLVTSPYCNLDLFTTRTSQKWKIERYKLVYVYNMCNVTRRRTNGKFLKDCFPSVSCLSSNNTSWVLMGGGRPITVSGVFHVSSPLILTVSTNLWGALICIFIDKRDLELS